MEMILAPLDEHFGKDLWRQQSLAPVATAASVASPPTVIRLPSLLRHRTSEQPKDRSPRLVGMSDVLSVNAVETRPLSPCETRLPSIGSMIRREANSPAPTHNSPKTDESLTSMSPSQKQCMDLYRQLRDVPSMESRSHPEYALGGLLAGVALNQLATMQQTKKSESEKVRTILPAISLMPASSEQSDKSKRTSSAKLCGMHDCRKRAKAGGFCIAHGGGLRCSESGCDKHAVSLGLCISHGGGKRCTVEGCLNASRKNGVCWSHGGKRLCKLEGCNKGPKSGGYCWSHGGKMKK